MVKTNKKNALRRFLCVMGAVLVLLFSAFLFTSKKGSITVSAEADYTQIAEAYEDTYENLLPYPYTFDRGSSSGVDYCTLYDGTLYMDGTLTADGSIFPFLEGDDRAFPVDGTYTISWNAPDYSVNDAYVLVYVDGVSEMFLHSTVRSVTKDLHGSVVRIKMFGYVGARFDNAYIKLMFNRGSVAQPYVPNLNSIEDNAYKEGVNGAFKGVFNGAQVKLNFAYQDYSTFTTTLTDIPMVGNQVDIPTLTSPYSTYNGQDFLEGSVRIDFATLLDYRGFPFYVRYKQNMDATNAYFGYALYDEYGGRYKLQPDEFIRDTDGNYYFKLNLSEGDLSALGSKRVKSLLISNSDQGSGAFVFQDVYLCNNVGGFQAGYDSAKIELSETVYQDGYNKGVNDGYNNGYDVGYRNGDINGYNRGFELGSNGAGFYSLMSAVVDVPIKALTGLLNFNILGVNMWDFAKSLFTLCLVVVVVRIFVK